MSRVLGGDFAAWFDHFFPECAKGQPATLFAPPTVSDRSDGKIAHLDGLSLSRDLPPAPGAAEAEPVKIAHLDGLSLSRAWCWRQIAAALPRDHAASPLVRAAAERHLEAALPHVAGDYMGEHWLATFALLALEA